MQIFGNVLLIVVAICNCVSYLPQIIKCFKTKSAEDLSISSWALWVASSLAYFLYAVLCQNNFMLIFECCLSLFFCIFIFVCAIVYRKRDVPKEKIKD